MCLYGVVLIGRRGFVGDSTFLDLLTKKVFVTAFIRWGDCRFLGLFCINPVWEDFRWVVEWLNRVQSLQIGKLWLVNRIKCRHTE